MLFGDSNRFAIECVPVRNDAGAELAELHYVIGEQRIGGPVACEMGTALDALESVAKNASARRDDELFTCNPEIVFAGMCAKLEHEADASAHARFLASPRLDAFGASRAFLFERDDEARLLWKDARDRSTAVHEARLARGEVDSCIARAIAWLRARLGR